MGSMSRLTKSVSVGVAALGVFACANLLWTLPDIARAYAVVGWGGYWEFSWDKWEVLRTGAISFLVFASAFLWQFRRSR
jgi:hypothetical protein